MGAESPLYGIRPAKTRTPRNQNMKRKRVPRWGHSLALRALMVALLISYLINIMPFG